MSDTFTESDRDLIRAQLHREKGSAPTDIEVELFVRQCERTKLDPFDRQIYATFRNDRRSGTVRMQVQATIDGFRVVAERSNKYVGQDGPYWCGPDSKWVDVWLAEDAPAAAKIGVWKSGAKAPTYGVATFKEYAQRGRNGQLIGLWPTMPSNQLAKCAEALALRKAFPNELSGIYTTEEMAQADNPSNTVEAELTALPVGTHTHTVPADQPAHGQTPPTPTPPEPETPQAQQAAALLGGADGGLVTGPPTPERKVDGPATAEELDALRELIRVTETADPFVRMTLIEFGIEDVGTVDEMLPKLTVGQALHVMTRINERMAA